MSQVRVTTGADDCRAVQAETVILNQLDVVLCNDLPEAGPARFRVVFRFEIEESGIAADTAIDSLLVKIPEFAAERGFRILFASDCISQRRQQSPPLLVCLYDLRKAN